MPLFRVNINCRNFLFEMDGKIRKHGFYTFRDVTSDNSTEAEYEAVQLIREHAGLRHIIKNPIDDPPTMHLEDIWEVEEPNPVEPGFIWYPEKNANPWWQFWKRGRRYLG